ncbi:hypothetical protein RND71_042455 [Anisodus tanguticus]|uniref:RNase H type-1 domain-containing protein n=1 Tax=Anisodus tanguticus TaxID=243964 RepID=A0AAE1QSG9_9SOLA|nr:hypothetical protein RND71_042455 [Anisodus tanguticus]
MAEVQAANFGIQWCRDNNISNLILEMDSKVIVDMIKGVNKPGWRLQYWVDKMQKNIKDLKAEVAHSFREATTVADSTAKYGAIENASRIFTQVNDLTYQAKGAYRQLPTLYFRKQTSKSSKYNALHLLFLFSSLRLIGGASVFLLFLY